MPTKCLVKLITWIASICISSCFSTCLIWNIACGVKNIHKILYHCEAFHPLLIQQLCPFHDALIISEPLSRIFYSTHIWFITFCLLACLLKWVCVFVIQCPLVSKCRAISKKLRSIRFLLSKHFWWRRIYLFIPTTVLYDEHLM